MDRRQFLIGAAAGAALPLVPTAVASAPVAPAALDPVWEVGTDGGMDWQLLRAPTLRDAMLEWMDERGSCEGCTPEDCECYGAPEGHRVPRLDDKLETTGRNEAAKIAGWCNTCERCDWSEIDPSDYYVLANDECVCGECMTLADWKTEDPEYYDEQMDELLTEEYGPDFRFPEYW